MQDVRDLLNAGADKVSIMTAAVENPDLVGECAVKIGSANLVLAIDARKATLPVAFPRSEAQPSGDLMHWEVFTHGGRRATGLDAVEWAQRMAAAGAGEILLTSMDQDGTRSGYDLAMVRAVADAVSIPVIASGGGGSAEDLARRSTTVPPAVMRRPPSRPRSSTSAQTTVGDVKRACASSGILVRIPLRTPDDASIARPQALR